MAVVRALWRLGMPLVVLLVIGGGGGFVVLRVQDVFGPENNMSYVDSAVTQAGPLSSRQVRYEVFGPAGAVADINYLDANAEPHQVNRTPLPWSVAIASDLLTPVSNLVAQGSSSTIGCRIVVDGEVKAERVSNKAKAFTHCTAKGA